MEDEYILVAFPDIQDFMEHERWDECIPSTTPGSYLVPKDLYNEVMNNKN